MTGSARDLPRPGGAPVAAGPRTASGHDAAWPPFRAAVLRELEDFFASPAHRVPCSPGSAAVGAVRGAGRAGASFIRPRLTLIAWRSFAQVSGGARAAQVPDASCVRLAASFEMLHAALLVHDDVVDRDWRRRAAPRWASRSAGTPWAAGASAEEAEHAGSLRRSSPGPAALGRAAATGHHAHRGPAAFPRLRRDVVLRP
ncbi:polyprenyl synthetase family protein [Kocuria rhizophila]|nr:polyprenyl synthetase family protein [Kocuria rhizophila]